MKNRQHKVGAKSIIKKNECPLLTMLRPLRLADQRPVRNSECTLSRNIAAPFKNSDFENNTLIFLGHLITLAPILIKYLKYA